jgi:hypothetical protein
MRGRLILGLVGVLLLTPHVASAIPGSPLDGNPANSFKITISDFQTFLPSPVEAGDLVLVEDPAVDQSLPSNWSDVVRFQTFLNPAGQPFSTALLFSDGEVGLPGFILQSNFTFRNETRVPGTTTDYAPSFAGTTNSNVYFIVSDCAGPAPGCEPAEGSEPGGVVPEPSTWLLLGSGLLGLMYLRKRLAAS